MTKSKIKVLEIARVPVGGIRKHIVSIVKSSSPDFEFFLATDDSQGDLVYQQDKGLNKEHIFSLPIPNPPHPKDLLLILKLYLRFRKTGITVIHGHGAKGGLYARILAPLLGAKVLYTAHGGSLHAMHGALFNILYTLVEKILYYFTDVLLFESRYSMMTYHQKIHSTKTKGRLVYNGTTLPALLQRQLPKGPLKIGAFGSLRKIKGHDLLIESFALLSKKYPSLTLLISGTGEEEENLRSLIKKLNLEGQAEVRTNTTFVEDEMKECDLIVQPSLFESFGYVPIEAMALSIPVISSSVGGLKEIIFDNKTGLIAELNPASIAQKIETVLTSPELYADLSKSGYEFVFNNFSEQKMTESITKFYKELHHE